MTQLDIVDHIRGQGTRRTLFSAGDRVSFVRDIRFTGTIKSVERSPAPPGFVIYYVQWDGQDDATPYTASDLKMMDWRQAS